MRYIAVSHSYHVHHKKWTINHLAANSRDEADMLASVQNDRLNKPFNATDTAVIEIADNEQLPPRGFKLTLWQRLTGIF